MKRFFVGIMVFLAIVAFGCEQVPNPVQVELEVPPQIIEKTVVKEVEKIVEKPVEVEVLVEVIKEVEVPVYAENPVEEKQSWDFLKNTRVVLEMPEGYEQSMLTASIEYTGGSIFIPEDQFKNHGDSRVVDSTWVNLLIQKGSEEFLIKVFFEQSAERTRTMVFLFEIYPIRENPQPAWQWKVGYEHKLFEKEPWYSRRVGPLPNGLDVDVISW